MISKGRENKEFIDLKVSQYDLLVHYFNINKIPTIINSPLRKDNNPSFGISSKDGETIYFYDFKTRESGDIFQLLASYWNITYKEVFGKIKEDLSNINKTSIKINKSYSKLKNFKNKNIELSCKVRKWKEWDIDFWESFGISKKWATFGRIYPISHIIIIRDNNKMVLPADKYAYCYVEFKDGKQTIKIYQPYNDRYKWMNNHNSSVWDLWEQLPEEGEELIITSSKKDALTIWENTGIPSISLQSESTFPKKHIIEQLKKRFKKIYVLYDNDFTKEDNPGKTLGKKLAEIFDLIQIEIPIDIGEKDSSDIVFNYGRQTLKEVIFKLIKKENYGN